MVIMRKYFARRNKLKKVDKIFKNPTADFKFERDLLCVLCSGIFSASGFIGAAVVTGLERQVRPERVLSSIF